MELRPIERRLLRWQQQGVPVEALAPMFKRSPEHLQRVLRLADMKADRCDPEHDFHVTPHRGCILR